MTELLVQKVFEEGVNPVTLYAGGQQQTRRIENIEDEGPFDQQYVLWVRTVGGRDVGPMIRQSRESIGGLTLRSFNEGPAGYLQKSNSKIDRPVAVLTSSIKPRTVEQILKDKYKQSNVSRTGKK